MTRLGIDTAAITAARWARSQRQRAQQVDNVDNMNVQPVTDVENYSNSPITAVHGGYGYGQGLQRFTSNTSVGPERTLSRVDEENVSGNYGGDERSMSSDSSSDSELEFDLEEEGFYAGMSSLFLYLFHMFKLTTSFSQVLTLVY